MRQRWLSFLAAMIAVLAFGRGASAGGDLTPSVSQVLHVTDGNFTSTAEWAGTNVASQTFAQVGDTGGSTLYVAQGTGGQAGTLFLMYDYWGSNTAGFTNPSTTFFDIFFAIPNDQSDYLVRVFGNGSTTQIFEKPDSIASPLTPGGSFDVNAKLPNSNLPLWTSPTPDDLLLANFHEAIGFHSSANNSDPHLMAEFQLTFDNTASPGGKDGIYDPAPAFWSASVGDTLTEADPPISSEIFSLNPLTGMTGLLGGTNNGVPVLQPSDIVTTPEPATVVGGLLGAAFIACVARRRRRV